MPLTTYSFTIGNLTLRSCDKHLLCKSQLPHITMEILCIRSNYNQECSFTVAYWQRSSDDTYNLKFVSNRPFQADVHRNHFWQLARMGQKILDNFQDFT